MIPISAAKILDINTAKIIAMGIESPPKLNTQSDCKNSPKVYAPDAKNAACPKAIKPKYPINMFKDIANKPRINTF